MITGSQICRLLENQYQYELEERRKNEAVSQATNDSMELHDLFDQPRRWTSDHIMKQQNAFVSEQRFIADYWPRIRTKGLGGVDSASHGRVCV